MFLNLHNSLVGFCGLGNCSEVGVWPDSKGSTPGELPDHVQRRSNPELEVSLDSLRLPLHGPSIKQSSGEKRVRCHATPQEGGERSSKDIRWLATASFFGPGSWQPPRWPSWREGVCHFMGGSPAMLGLPVCMFWSGGKTHMHEVPGLKRPPLQMKRRAEGTGW